jgi:hypothetical protein
MKKWLLWLLVIIAGIFVFAFFALPAEQTDTFETTFACPPPAVTRQIINKEKWANWWPGKKINDSTYSYKNDTYKIQKILLNGFQTIVYDDKDSIKGLLQFIYFGMDSTKFKWTSDSHFSKNPFNRLEQSRQIKKLNANVVALILDMQKFFSVPANVYGMDIVEERIKDSTMIATRKTFDHYPTTKEIYEMIHSVKKYIKDNHGEENNYPMLNIHKEGEARYEAMIGVPTTVDLPAKGKFELKKMVLGVILRGTVVGGVERVKEGEKELAFFVTDHHKYSPAIPFQSLVTDRLSEPDSSKWITKLYYPIFY